MKDYITLVLPPIEHGLNDELGQMVADGWQIAHCLPARTGGHDMLVFVFERAQGIAERGMTQ